MQFVGFFMSVRHIFAVYVVVLVQNLQTEPLQHDRLTSFTVDPRVAVFTRALVLVRPCIAARSSVHTRLVRSTVV